jgi:HemY protein
MTLWAILRGVLRTPARMRKSRRDRRQARGRHAITQGCWRSAHGDSHRRPRPCQTARKHAAHDPLALLLHAQSAQLDGDRDGARRALPRHGRARGHAAVGLRGCSSRRNAPTIRWRSVMVAEEALKLAPSSSWASHAVLGFCCARATGPGALKILDNNQSGRADRQGGPIGGNAACC